MNWIQQKAIHENSEFTAAYEYYKAGKYKEAGEICAQVLRGDSDDVTTSYLLGLLYAQAGKISEAASIISGVQYQDPKFRECESKERLFRHLGDPSCVPVWESALAQYVQLQEADSIIISYPKCGRTWLRSLLGHYLLGEKEGNPLNVQSISKGMIECPNIVFTHDDEPHKKPFTMIERDKSLYSGSSVLFLARDPRDIVVSNYFDYTKRGGGELANDPEFSGTLSEFIRHDIGGINSIVCFLNAWALQKSMPNRFSMVCYEDLKENTARTLQKILRFIQFPKYSHSRIKLSVKKSDFKSMQIMEEENKFGDQRLSPGSHNDRESFKVRRGVVGGYLDYLNTDDINYLNQYIKQYLHPIFKKYH